MQAKIKTLTPIWTGDVKRESAKLRETSVIGSLRWWFEALVRGLGGYACGGINNKCEYKDNASSLCPVCQVFGTTGWSRRFRLEVNGRLNRSPFVIVKADERESHRGWFLGSRESGGLVGTSEVKIYGDSQIKNVLALLLNLSCSWGIGAKTQDGFGICDCEFETGYSVNKAIEKVKKK